MCLGIPGQVVIIGEPINGLLMGRVCFSGVEKEVCLGYTPDVKVGDYVLVHVGFALSRLEPELAASMLEDLEAIERLGRSTPRHSEDSKSEV